MGNNEEHLCFMLFLDNYVQKKEKMCVKKYCYEIYEEIFRVLAMFLMKIW